MRTPLEHFLPRKLLELVYRIREMTDEAAGLITLLFVASYIVNTLAEKHFPVAHVCEEIILYLHLVFFALFALGFVLSRVYMKGPPIPDLNADTVSDLRTWVTVDGHDPRTARMVEFVTNEKRQPELLQLNYDGFVDSEFGVELEKLERRNASWIAKNQKLFLLMINPRTREYFGYSCFVPLNENGTTLYRDGVLKDADIPVELVCATDERPHSVLFFALMLKEKYRIGRGLSGFTHTTRLLKGLRYHLRQMYAPWITADGRPLPPLLTQTHRGSISRRLRTAKFVKTGAKTADGFPLWELTLP
jgi:hypothetical protein